ncbi:dihydroneopterin aldolase [Deinococcus maricopensis]|uniref:7,8-dihydroneopterin aldolase n=1 Tax=Deinococcus maricopensis (strain DSM 21211 / LMG 22137 / NRRL B-23946 / LB-34) TaxID=709986 RepID=E8U6A3_DEIML|nr:dihydroneopterin aldolase [Deinococcus maricopensis]ADV66592.1 dihydroneopterin aldolase [Deinococcus maricopensis DSM 21211]
MGKVVLSGLEFHGRHGVYDEEAVFGARFIVDVEMHFEFGYMRDHIDDTVNYALVYDAVRDEAERKRYKLIEVLAQAVATRLLDEHARLLRVTVRVHKPHAPIAGIFRDVYAEVTRERA